MLRYFNFSFFIFVHLHIVHEIFIWMQMYTFTSMNKRMESE